MITNTTITRRSLSAAAPAAAVAVAIPATASDLAGWHRVKATYAAACDAESAAIDRQTEAEEALSEFWHTAPEREVTYTEAGFTNGGISVQPAQHTRKLTRHDVAGSHLSASLRTSGEYLDFVRDVQAWKNDPAHVAAQTAFDNADAATMEAMTAKIAAWGAMVDFPLSDAATIADKMATALPYVDGCGEWGERLLVAVQADLSRVLA